jgi:hypothetical protein
VRYRCPKTKRNAQLLHLLLADGKLTGVGAVLLFLLGISMMLGAVVYLPTVGMRWLGTSVGLGCMAVAGLSGRAKALGLPPPFTNDPLGWRKAKATYQPQAISEADPRSASPNSEHGGSDKK